MGQGNLGPSSKVGKGVVLVVRPIRPSMKGGRGSWLGREPGSGTSWAGGELPGAPGPLPGQAGLSPRTASLPQGGAGWGCATGSWEPAGVGAPRRRRAGSRDGSLCHPPPRPRRCPACSRATPGGHGQGAPQGACRPPLLGWTRLSRPQVSRAFRSSISLVRAVFTKLSWLRHSGCRCGACRRRPTKRRE